MVKIMNRKPVNEKQVADKSAKMEARRSIKPKPIYEH